MNDVPSLAQLIKQAIDNRLLDVHTAMIGKVERYDAEKQLVDVVPMLKRYIKDIEGSWQSEELPMLCDLPVLFPRAGGYFISFPIQPGDFVQVIFNEANIEEWFDESAPTIVDNQRFTLQGAVPFQEYFLHQMLSQAPIKRILLWVENAVCKSTSMIKPSDSDRRMLPKHWLWRAKLKRSLKSSAALLMGMFMPRMVHQPSLKLHQSATWHVERWSPNDGLFA